MTFWGKTQSGRRIPLGDPAQVAFSRDADAPADLLRVTFPSEKAWEELEEITVYREESPVFRGVIDEQNTTLSSSGLTVELIARSREALLLDNEACPGTYAGVTLETLEDRFLLPLGMTLGAGDRTAKAKSLSVTKGDNVWSVLAAFCSSLLGTVPYVDPDGRVQCGDSQGKTIVLHELLSATWSLRPCKRLGEVVLQSTRGTYDTPFRAEGGPLRRRYLSCGSGKDPRAMLSQGEQDSFRLTVTCPGELWPSRQDRVSVTVPGLGRFEDCPIQNARIRRDDGGLCTELTLKGGSSSVADATADT